MRWTFLRKDHFLSEHGGEGHSLMPGSLFLHFPWAGHGPIIQFKFWFPKKVRNLPGCRDLVDLGASEDDGSKVFRRKCWRRHLLKLSPRDILLRFQEILTKPKMEPKESWTRKSWGTLSLIMEYIGPIAFLDWNLDFNWTSCKGDFKIGYVTLFQHPVFAQE